MSGVAFNTVSLATVTQGQVRGATAAFTSISTDTRTLQPGALFVALKGPNFDGHDYVGAALEQGASAALVERDVSLPIAQVVVPDVLTALTQFAHAWRGEFKHPVIGVTGSNGKTTTKEMLGSILSQRGPTLVTRGNLNNHIGVPLTLLTLNDTQHFAVIEMGASGLGEIGHLARTAEPVIGLITNAGAAHLEGFGDLDGVARGKGELYLALPAAGVAIINADDTYAGYWRRHNNAGRVLTFGVDRAADFSAATVLARHETDGFYTHFELQTPDGRRQIDLQLAGIHNLRNALGAAAAAYAAGASLDDIQAGLNAMRPVGGRLQPKPAIKGAALIDDSYNANPNSVRAGIDALQSRGGRGWLIFGEMRELGADAASLHAEIGRYARAAGVERVFAIGEHSRHTVTAFGAGAQWFASLDELIACVTAELASDITVLVKGSRGNRLERAAAALAVTQGGSVDAMASHH